jgi:predicted permease
LIELFIIFLNNLLPVFLAAGAGYLLARLTHLNPRPISQIIFYIFSPCLIFTLLTQSELSDGDILRVSTFAIATMIILAILTWLVGKAFGLDRRTLAGVLMSTMFVNAGNFGLPVILFAFGEEALRYASLYFVTNAVMIYTVGVIIASMGSVSLSKAFSNLLRIPGLYALIMALIFMRTGWKLPLPIVRTTTLLGDASIPAMLVLLGMQLNSVNWAERRIPITLASSLRLLAGPLVALVLSPLWGISGVARQAVTMEAATPTAVLATVVATEYDAAPSLVTSVVFVTTLISPLTITPLMAYLGA